MCPSQRKAASAAVVLCSAGSAGRGGVGEKTITNGRPVAAAAAEIPVKETMKGPSAPEVDYKSTVSGGVDDFYGEDLATEEELITPRAVSVAR